jgi:hypothetical protein
MRQLRMPVVLEATDGPNQIEQFLLRLARVGVCRYNDRHDFAFIGSRRGEQIRRHNSIHLARLRILKIPYDEQ